MCERRELMILMVPCEVLAACKLEAGHEITLDYRVPLASIGKIGIYWNDWIDWQGGMDTNDNIIYMHYIQYMIIWIVIAW